ncbi:nucleotidyltransferase family protein [Pedobacter yonginense]|uniref:Nucleotidyltransferase family protein n=1 Tax=Pedobacter yonginense TaxID=651869 RepID=A0A317EH87_9SPHI|nr:nucleotidyltransferase family protein [Pedobacter yonginense]PWS26022.1 nucleotidyltransferase family protein [Pedobacter yonginense]
MNTGTIILAAGSSSRLGRPKQLLDFNGKTLLSHVIDEVQEAGIQPIIVVLGANASVFKQEIKDTKVVILENEAWKTGMASAIQVGVSEITKQYDVENLIIAVCDQPHISSAIFTSLINKKNSTGKGIIASTYQNIIGTPVLFDKKYFDALKALTGEEGAKKIVKHYTADVETVAFENGEIDIDTETDYLNLQHKISK